jgi:ribonuclease D
VVSGTDVYLIDPLSIDDWAPLVAVLEDPDRTLIMHACSEDLELMSHHLGATPAGLFDTQLAHAFVSTDFALSYTNLVNAHLGIEVGKPQTRSDWRRRPLSDAQVRYACEDVEHLPALHRRLCERLDELGRRDWFEETMTAQGGYTAPEPDEYYRSISRAWRLCGADLAVLRSLTGWRERKAMSENVPRNRVVWDEHLVSFAQEAELGERKVRETLPRPIARRYGEEIVDAHRSGREAPALPALEAPLTQSQARVSKKLRDIARREADERAFSQELLARRREVERCVRHFLATGRLSEAYSGWREALVGDKFREVLAQLR